MKTFLSRTTIFVAVTSLSIFTLLGETKPDPLVAKYTTQLKPVPAPELPATAATLVVKAPTGQQTDIALAIVRAVSSFNTAAFPAVVGAIARAEPSLASMLTTEALGLQPKLASTIKASVGLQTTQAQPTGKPDAEKKTGAVQTTVVQVTSTPANSNGTFPIPQAFPNPGDDNGNGNKKGHYKHL
jgi:hypothetical protein